jgi:hypothetical protein
MAPGPSGSRQAAQRLAVALTVSMYWAVSLPLKASSRPSQTTLLVMGISAVQSVMRSEKTWRHGVAIHVLERETWAAGFGIGEGDAKPGALTGNEFWGPNFPASSRQLDGTALKKPCEALPGRPQRKSLTLCGGLRCFKALVIMAV